MRRNRATSESPFAMLAFAQRLFLGLLLPVLLLSFSPAQSNGDLLNGMGSHRDRLGEVRSYVTAPNTGVLIFKVFAERHGTQLDRQALLKLVNRATQITTWQTTEMSSQGPYSESASQGVLTDIPYGIYDVEVSAVGYLSSHKELVVGSTVVQE